MIGLRGMTQGEPDKGYDTKATEWGAKLNDMDPTAQPK